MKKQFSITQSHIRAKIIGIIFIAIGVIFFINPTSLDIKIGFASILIGIFMIFMITEKSVPKKTSDAEIKGNLDAVKNIIRELHLDGHAIFLPKSDILTEERILIPPDKSGIIRIPNIDNNHVFLMGKDGKNLGVAIPPSGLNLLKELEKNEDFENNGVENIDEKLQKFVGMNLLTSISLKKLRSGFKLEMNKPLSCPNDQNLCTQYPCPTCSAVLTAISRASTASQKKLWINRTTHNGKKVTFYLNFIDQRSTQGNEPC